jgi:hypothetical protein
VTTTTPEVAGGKPPQPQPIRVAACHSWPPEVYIYIYIYTKKLRNYELKKLKFLIKKKKVATTTPEVAGGELPQPQRIRVAACHSWPPEVRGFLRVTSNSGSKVAKRPPQRKPAPPTHWSGRTRPLVSSGRGPSSHSKSISRRGS